MNGILLVDKPAGITSAEVVRRVKRQVAVKVGHLGTLDPFATGVLPLCLGEATKIAQFLNTADKRYEGRIRLGAATDTGDPTGSIVQTAAVPALTETAVAAVAQRFAGDYAQVPPMYSALKHQGVPLYKLARRGIAVERSGRTVRIHELRLLVDGPEHLRFDVSCSKGTYVRVLAEDIGVALGTVAHLEVLRRTRFGDFDVARAVQLDAATVIEGGMLIAIPEALGHLRRFRLETREVDAARKGQGWVLGRLGNANGDDFATLVDHAGAVVAVIGARHGRWMFARVLDRGA